MPDEKIAECAWVLAEMGDRDPSAEVSRRIERHLAACPSCRLARKWDQQLAALLRGDSLPVAGAEIEGRVQAILSRRQALRWSSTASLVASAATVLICLGTAWCTGWLSPEPEARRPFELWESPAGDSLPLEMLTVLLANHHRMQVELREIVDQERFTILQQRLRYLVTPTAPAAPKQEPSPESKQPVAPERNHE
jgi:hypothetical protein